MKNNPKFYGKAKYSNPGDRPQYNNAGKINRDAIFTRLSSDNSAMQRALGVGVSDKKKSSFLKKVN